MKKQIRILFVGALLCVHTSTMAKTYYISPSGSDAALGSLEQPWGTLAKAQDVIQGGDTLFIRGGEYKVQPDQMMRVIKQYNCAFYLNKSGVDQQHPICYWAYPGDERPIFNLSAVKDTKHRIAVFYIAGDYLHLKGFDIVGTQVAVKGHTQSECISVRGGNHNTFENIAMHDGMAIGYYLVDGSDNLVLNCDAYNNYDYYSEGEYGGNTDGFGCHPLAANCTGNRFVGCRAYYNSDDGYDLINASAAVTFDHCYALYNGYKPQSTERAGDGNGFKAGGYGMNERVKLNGSVVPEHIITNCIAYGNKANGFYANHHLGGNLWSNNRAMANSNNYNMLNRKCASEIVDVDGYGHILENNLSFKPRGKDCVNIDLSQCKVKGNNFIDPILNYDSNAFKSVNPQDLLCPRNPDGSLPITLFMELK